MTSISTSTSCRFLLLLTAAFLFSACQAQTSKTASKKENTSKAMSTNFKEGKDYITFERARVLDRVGFAQPAEAYSILLPKGWQYNGNLDWRVPGSGCEGTFNYFKAQSPDGAYSLEIFPTAIWNWTSNQYMQQFNQPQNSYCTQDQPMDAAAYLSNRFAPQQLGSPLVSGVKPNEAVVKEMAMNNDKARQELMRYGASQVNFYQTAVSADLKWKNNTEGIALCGVSISEMIIPNPYDGTYSKSVSCVAAKKIVFRFPAGEKEQAAKLLSVMMGSFHTNPAWQTAVNTFWKNFREKRQIDHIGTIRMIDERTRQIGEAAIKKGNERLATMDNEYRSWEAKQSTDDRMHNSFIKTIREVENYRDETGKIELSAGYDHAWSRSDGSSFIMSNNPNFDPAGVLLDNRWKEMKKVD